MRTTYAFLDDNIAGCRLKLGGRVNMHVYKKNKKMFIWLFSTFIAALSSFNIFVYESHGMTSYVTYEPFFDHLDYFEICQLT